MAPGTRTAQRLGRESRDMVVCYSLLQELTRVPLVEGSGEEEDDVVDHVPIAGGGVKELLGERQLLT